jgi:hypothetical protein
LSKDDGKRNGVQAARSGGTDGMDLSNRNIEEMIKNYRKEVLGIESAIPKIC